MNKNYCCFSTLTHQIHLVSFPCFSTDFRFFSFNQFEADKTSNIAKKERKHSKLYVFTLDIHHPSHMLMMTIDSFVNRFVLQAFWPNRSQIVG